MILGTEAITDLHQAFYKLDEDEQQRIYDEVKMILKLKRNSNINFAIYKMLMKLGAGYLEYENTCLLTNSIVALIAGIMTNILDKPVSEDEKLRLINESLLRLVTQILVDFKKKIELN